MAITQQILHEIRISGLRGLENMDISFDGKPVTGIFGVNGCGKTTLLYVLLCLYGKNNIQGTHYNFGSFFKRCSQHEFDDVEIEATVSYRDDRNVFDHKTYSYRKSPHSDRWTPRTPSRPKRDVFFLGINSCVPRVEDDLRVNQMYNFVGNRVISQSIIDAARNILGIDYTNITKTRRGNKDYYHALRADGANYYSVSMGAGEQRIMRLLELLDVIPAYSLVVIDEIDLTLHTAALNRLVDYIIGLGDRKHIQFVFTSHRESLTIREDINVRHLLRAGGSTLCFNNTNAACYDSMTGSTTRPLEIYVEDDLAEQIVSVISEHLGIRKRVQIHRYGACENAFVVSSALKLMEKSLDKCLFVLDGDIYKTNEERLAQIRKHYTGNEIGSDEARNEILNAITSFNLPEGQQPEQYINDIIKQRIAESNDEIVGSAMQIVAPIDKHDYLNKIIEDLGDSREIGLYKLVKELQIHSVEWNNYVSNVFNWLRCKKGQYNL